MNKKAKSGLAEGYLHGYSKEEQNRLYEQARFLSPSVYEHIDFSKQTKVLEVGCGVGAQTTILLEKFPHLQIHGIDASSKQIATARERLKKWVKRGQVKLEVADAMHLPLADNSFDGVFVCWFLEHVREPIEILREIRRTLSPEGVIFCSEVFNSSLFVHPYSPATLQYWFAFNDHQWMLKGDPFVGAKLANYLLAAGYQKVEVRNRFEYYDNRTPKRRAEFIEYWIQLLLSGAPALVKARKIQPKLVEEMKNELTKLKEARDAVFYYSWMQARAQVF